MQTSNHRGYAFGLYSLRSCKRAPSPKRCGRTSVTNGLMNTADDCCSYWESPDCPCKLCRSAFHESTIDVKSREDTEPEADDATLLRQAFMKDLRAVCTSRDSRILICNACQVFSSIVQREDPGMMEEVFKPEFIGIMPSLDYLANPERYGRLRTIPSTYRRPGQQMLTGYILINQ